MTLFSQSRADYASRVELARRLAVHNAGIARARRAAGERLCVVCGRVRGTSRSRDNVSVPAGLGTCDRESCRSTRRRRRHMAAVATESSASQLLDGGAVGSTGPKPGAAGGCPPPASRARSNP